MVVKKIENFFFGLEYKYFVSLFVFYFMLHKLQIVVYL